jgi:hypothetical protein
MPALTRQITKPTRRKFPTRIKSDLTTCQQRFDHNLGQTYTGVAQRFKMTADILEQIITAALA